MESPEFLSSLFTLSNSMIKSLLEFSIKSSLILGFVIALSFLLRNRSAAARHGVLTIGVCAALLLPVAGTLLPSLEVPILPSHLFESEYLSALEHQLHIPGSGFPSITVPGPGGTANSTLQANETSTGMLAASDPIGSFLNASSYGRIPWQAWLLCLWLAGAFIVFIVMILNNLEAWKTLRKARGANGKLLKLSSQVLAGLKRSRRVQILQSDRTSVPMTCGIFRPFIVFPLSAETWNSTTIQSVLCHELAHVQRHDILRQLITQVLCIVQWFNPLVWVAGRIMMIEREKACDDAVLNGGTKPSNYAANLMKIAETMQRKTHSLWTPAAMVQHNNFKERVMAILDSRTNRTTPGRLGRYLSILAAALLLIPLSAFSPWAGKTKTGAQTIDGAMSNFAAIPDKPELKVSSHNLKQGDPVLFKLTAPDSVHSATGEFMGQKLSFHSESDGFYALAAVDRKAQPGEYFVVVDYVLNDGSTKGFKIQLNVKAGIFNRYKINLESNVERGAGDAGILKQVYGTLSPEVFWSDSFQRPMDGRLTMSFGHAVQFNEQKETVHNGVDIASPKGTPIRASNSGKIVLARLLKTWGNIVVIDHGGGVQTCYAHLADISVKEGQMVKKGGVIGTCGSTGRSTAPHLHWMARINGVECDPLELVDLTIK